MFLFVLWALTLQVLQTLDLQRLTIRLKIALRAEAQLKGYQNLLKYMAVKTFVTSWKHRTALRKLHKALAALVEVCHTAKLRVAERSVFCAQNALEFQTPVSCSITSAQTGY